MLNLFRKKPDPNNIKTFQDIINLIDFYIDEKKWKLAHQTLEKTIKVEQENAKKEIEKLDKTDENIFNKNKEIINKKLEQNISSLKKLENKLEINEEKYRFIPERIRKYDDAIKSIKTLIALKEWEQVDKAIDEIKKIERKAYQNLLENLEKEFKINGEEELFEEAKKKQQKIYNKKIIQLDKLLAKKEKEETIYKEKRDKEKFKIRFKKIKNEIDFLVKTGKNPEALNILKHFLEENSDNVLVINFYNKEKEKILKRIEKIRIQEEKKLQKNIKAQAEKLIGKTLKTPEKKEENKKETFFEKIKKQINFYKNFREKLKRKELLDEVTLLIEENDNFKKKIATDKLENIHKGLIKEISDKNVNGYEIYGKILGADKISGDTFGLEETDKKYNLILGDATGHGVKAGLIITLLTRLFRKYHKKSIAELAFEINNGLKQDLESRNFITGILFEINKEKTQIVEYVGMGHEPMLIYRAKTKKVEKLIPGGLAAGIRMIKKIEQIKVKKITLEDGDIILTYSDGVLESKGVNGEYYGINKLIENFGKIAQIEKNPKKLYKHLIDHLIAFRGGTAFDDDTTVLLFKRDENKEIQTKNSEFIAEITSKEHLDRNETKKLIGKSKEEIFEELKKIKKEKQLKSIIKNLKKLYYVGEFLKLKQECVRLIKDGWIHKDINKYLKLAINNEVKYKIEQKNKKIENLYLTLEQLYKKGDYDTVIKEIEDIISKDGEI